MLINQVNFELCSPLHGSSDESSLHGLSDDAIIRLTEEEGKVKLREICIEPLKQLAGLDIPHVAVSSGHCHFEYLVRA